MKFELPTSVTFGEAAHMGAFVETGLSEKDAVASQIPPGAFSLADVTWAHKQVHKQAASAGQQPASSHALRVAVMDRLVASMLVNGDDYIERSSMEAGTVSLVEFFK